MSGSAFGHRYATALLELAAETSQTAKIQRDLASVLETWQQSRELRDVFENPAFSTEVRAGVLEGVSKRLGLSPLLTNTLRLLSDRGRLRQLPELVESFNTLAQDEGGVVAEVTSATELSASYYTKLQMSLEKSLGKKVTVVKKTDPSLIAGVVTRVGDKVFDGTVASRLRHLREGLLP